MFFMSEKILQAAHKVAETLIATGQERGEIPFSPIKPITVTTDCSKVGNMVYFDMGGKSWYIGFE